MNDSKRERHRRATGWSKMMVQLILNPIRRVLDFMMPDRVNLKCINLLPIMLLSCLILAGGAGAVTRLLVIGAAQDTAGAFQALSLPELERRALIWPEGVLTISDTLPWLDDGSAGLAFELQEAALAGVGSGGRFRFHSGSYDLDTPFVLTDGVLFLSISAGKLEVSADRITYWRPQTVSVPGQGRRGEYYVLAGLILATALLLRAARRRTRQP